MSTAITVPVAVHGQNEFDERVEMSCGGSLHAQSIDRIQVNIGLTCDLACRHCHVESSPKRKEQMDWPTMLLVLRAAKRAGAETLDITGGAPEMNPNFRRFVMIARCRDLDVLVRTNLTIMRRDGYTDLPEFYRLIPPIRRMMDPPLRAHSFAVPTPSRLPRRSTSLSESMSPWYDPAN